MTPLDRIRDSLGWVRRAQARRRATAAGEGSLWLSVLFVIVGSVVLGVFYARTLQVAVLAGWVLALVGFWTLRFALPTLRSRRDTDTARLLEAHARELRTDLTGALQFGEVLTKEGAGGARRLGSPELMGAHVTRVADGVAKQLPVYERRLPTHEPRRLRKVGLAAGAAFVMVLLVAPEIAQTGLRRLFIGPAPVAPTMETAAAHPAEPLVAGIRVTYRYPAYTGRDPIRLDNPTGRIEILAGTEVTLRAHALRPLVGAGLVLRSEAASTEDSDNRAADGTVAAVADAPGVARTEIDMSVAGSLLEVVFTPLQSGVYHVEGITPEGTRLRDPIRRAIEVVPDAPPQVELMTPGEAVVSAAVDEVVPFRFTVSDDYGLTEVGFAHALVGDEAHERRQTLLSLDGNLAFQDAAGFDLGPLGLQPRDEVLVYLEATDNDTIGGPKVGRSRPIRIRIAAPEDRHLETVAREEEIFEALLTTLGDYLEWPIGVLTRANGETVYAVPDRRPGEYGDTYHAANRINASLLDTLHEMRDLLTAMEEDELLLRAHFERFRAIHDRLDERRRATHAVLTSLSRPAARGELNRAHMIRLDTPRQAQETGTEEAILEIEEMIAEQRMESLVRTLEELDQIQDRLRDLLEQYRDTDDPAIREEIERELARLEARMQELLQRLAEQMEQVPREHYNVEALEEMGMMQDVDQMTSALQQIRDLLEQGDIDAALEALENLESQIDSMMSQMSESLESGSGGVSELDERIAELMEEVNDLAAQEAALEEQTAELQEQIRQQRTAEVEAELDEFLERAAERVEAMQRELDSVPSESIRSDIARDVEASEAGLEALARDLEQRDIASALEQSDGLLSQLGTAERELRRMAQRRTGAGDTYDQAGRSVGSVQRDTAALAREMEQLIERARPVPGPGDMPALQELGRQQGETAERLEALRQRLNEMGGEMPMIEQELGPALEGVGQHMRRAQGQLGEGELQPGVESERDALQGLETMRQQMHQMVARERMGRRRNGQTSRERVEIPAEPEETPEEFRRDILDAMRDDSLGAYEEANRAYYESLVE